MEPVSAETLICSSCDAELAPNAKRCDNCGTAVASDATDDTNRGKSEKRRRLIDNPWAILAFMFGAAMVTGLPFLWISRGFSTLGKVVWTVLVTLYTVLVFWGFWLVMCWCVPRIWEPIRAWLGS